MCGIAGIVGFADRGTALAAVESATNRLVHRGPDACGIFADPIAILGNRRLSVIDPSERSNQPVTASDASAALVVNGEVYNYRALRADLKAKGEQFESDGDAEVLLHLLMHDGVDALPKVLGMFALAFWRADRRELLLARDRFGEKPLYFARLGSGLAFASEIAALLEFPGVSRRLNRGALPGYLEAGYVATPQTLFEDIIAIEPGRWLKWRDGQVTTGEYHDWVPAPDAALDDSRAAREAVFSALANAVARQSVSDVPLGVLLSGGIDSSSVAALLQHASSRPIKTFTIRFEEASYDESAVARRVAQHLGTEHHELTVANASFNPDDLWRIVDHVGQPFYDSSAIPTFMVSRFAREHVTVALSGDGGDEMFAGYEVFDWSRRIERLASAPSPALAAGAGALRAIARIAPSGAATLVRQSRKAFEIAAIDDEMSRFRAMHRLMEPETVSSLVEEGPRPSAREYLPVGAVDWTRLRRMMYVRARDQLANDMLAKVDRMSMAASLEVRAPFLDPEVAAVSARLPDAQVLCGGVGKFALREAMKPHLPAEVFAHPKRGFSLPLHRFINDDFRTLSRELLSPAGPLRDVLRPDAVGSIMEAGLSRVGDEATMSVFQATHQLWSLVQLAAWMQRFRVTT